MRTLIFWGFIIASTAQAIPLDSWPTWSTAQPYVSKQVPPGAMIVRGSGTNAYYVLEADPTTGAIPVDIGGGGITVDFSGPTGSAVPADAGYMGGIGPTGNLTGIRVDANGELQVDVLSSALPSGAATEATLLNVLTETSDTTSNTADIVTNTGSINTKTPALGQAAMAASSPVVIASNQTAVPVTSSNLPTTASTNVGAADASTLRVTEGSRTYADSFNKDYSTGNVTTGAWVELIASTAAAINLLCLTDTSGQVMEIGTGSAASEARVFLVAQGWSGCIPLRIASGTRVSVRAVTATASSGYLTISGMN